MKEFERRAKINSEDLTQKINPSTLDVRGNVSMAEPERGEDPQSSRKPISEPPVGRDITPNITPDRQEQIKAWVKNYLKGRKLEDLPFEEQQTIRTGMEMGIPAIAGGATALDESKYTDERLTPVVGEVNREFRESGGVYEPDYLIEIRNKVRELRDAGADAAQANDLIAEINRFLREQREQKEEGQRKKDEQYEKRISLGRGHGIENVIKKYQPEELLTDRKKRDEVFNDIFALVDSNTQEFWDRAFNTFTSGMDLEAFIDLVRKGSIGRFEDYGVTNLTDDQKNILRQELKQDLIRYQTERDVRKFLHDANALLDQPSINMETVHNYLQGFSSEFGDFAHRLTGVPEMMDLYEMALREDMRENDGYLRPEAVKRTVRSVQKRVNPNDPNSELETVLELVEGDAGEKTKARFKELMKRGKLILRTEEGARIGTKPLEDWEIDRVFTIARGMMMMSERIISIAAESKLPKGGVYTSLYLQDILQNYAPYVHLLTKYGVAESGLAAYLYKDNQGKNLLDLLGLWSKNDLERALAMVQNDPAGFLQSSDYRYLMRVNPNMAGDLFTWLSWRAGEEPESVTMTRRFLKDGRDRMIRRKFGIDKELPELAEKKEYQGKRMYSRFDFVKYPENASDEVILTANINYFRNQKGLPSVSVEEVKDYVKGKEIDEYGNWIGTALRLERLRSNLSGLESRDLKKRQDFSRALEKAENILSRMSVLQPHRLYSVSSQIKERIEGSLSSEQRERIGTILANLHLVERTLLENRERLLDEGKTFDTVSLDEFFEVIEDPQERADAIQFANLVVGDFAQNKQKYLDEFVYNREYTHGYVLWSGDAPLNEFNVSALGPTGGFARRARDNKAASEAAVEEIKMLMNLRNIRTPEEVVSHLWAIYEKIATYDSGKAKQAIAEKAEGIIKFFAADMKSQIPVIGNILGKFERVSFAQVVYGKSASVWQPAEARAFLVKLKDAQMITPAQFNELSVKGFASPIAVGRDIGVTMAQIIAIAMALYMFEELRKERR